jgi:hypothetical protein
MKTMTRYYVPGTLADQTAFGAQFERHAPRNKLDTENPIQFPASPSTFGYDMWQDILKSPRPYPCTLEIFSEDKQAIASMRTENRNHLETLFDWYWENSKQMTLGYRFTPVAQHERSPSNLYSRGRKSK